jgi:hypothetical protein
MRPDYASAAMWVRRMALASIPGSVFVVGLSGGALIFAAPLGLILGGAQWIAVRQFVPLSKWLLGSMLGSLGGAIGCLALGSALLPLGLALSGSVLGLCQSIALNLNNGTAWKWIGLSCFGTLAGFSVSSWIWAIDSTGVARIVSVFGGASIGILLYGAVTAVGVPILLREAGPE